VIKAADEFKDKTTAITLAASTAGRLNSNPDEPEPPFPSRLISLKSSDDGQLGPKKPGQVRAWRLTRPSTQKVNGPESFEMC
jgi:hypothetical protein